MYFKDLCLSGPDLYPSHVVRTLYQLSYRGVPFPYIVGTHGISIRYTSFMKESVMCRNPVGFDDEWGVTDRNPVGSDDVSLEPLYQFQLNIAQSQGPG